MTNEATQKDVIKALKAAKSTYNWTEVENWFLNEDTTEKTAKEIASELIADHSRRELWWEVETENAEDRVDEIMAVNTDERVDEVLIETWIAEEDTTGRTASEILEDILEVYVPYWAGLMGK